ncbi:MATE family efflux transporter [Solimonas variicoloris]|uniref:MATE family efflux transporter n=1 Tax=Solimonas variicoloris TaxID=254408 RepID=UPI00035E30C9|nr:MATE family efflux transporter [Solimonas variicoloris]
MAARDLTGGAVRGHLLRMSGFMLLTMLVQTAYGLIDIFWVGRLGRDAVAAVALGSNLMMALMAVAQTLSVGATALVAQAAGRKDFDEARRLFTQSQLLSALLALLFLVVALALYGPYSDRLAGSAEVARLTREFLVPFIPAMALQIPMFVLSAALRGVGDVRSASFAQLGTVLLNIVLAPVLIFGWGTGRPLGVAGAALTTLIAVLIGMAGLLIHVLRQDRFLDRHAAAWRPQPAVWRRMVRIGLPSGLELGVLAVYFGFIMAMLRSFGAAPQAAFGIGMRVLQFGVMPAMAISFATAAIVGQNFGAGQPGRVRQAFVEALKLNLAAVGLFCLVFQLAPDALMRPFSADPAVIRYGAEFLRWISWNLLAMGVVAACGGVFAGFGNTLPSLFGTVVRFGFIVTVGLLLSAHADFAPVWLWALSIGGTLLQLALNLLLLRCELHRHLLPLERTSLA